MLDVLARKQLQFTEAEALALDAADALRDWRSKFSIPRENGREVAYFCGNSLGLQPRAARDAVTEVLDDWATMAVDAHFKGKHPWFPYHEFCREAAARLVGAQSHEVVMMNGLTVNLHLLMATFYRPTPARRKILIESTAFPSDIYATQTQIAWHGFDPGDDLLVAQPRPGEHTLRTEDIVALLEREGSSIALVMLGAVNYFTGQRFDLREITRAAHAAGCIVGVDCAHAAGNVPLSLHDDDVDFGAWCTYKYLNSGPGSVAGAFVHERHARNIDLPRLGGWWGNDPQSRFRMHLNERFQPVATADAWQLSNPPILSLAAVRASLEIFDAVGMETLWNKSRAMIAYMEQALAALPAGAIEVITPRDLAHRGCQWSLMVHEQPQEFQKRLQAAGVVGDFRPPNVVRIAPVPLYNSFHDLWRFREVMHSLIG
jgi:kynureninase